MKQRSTIGSELAWLGIFVAILVVLEYAMLRFVVPHHFNDRVAVMIAAIVAGVIWILLRARYTRGNGAH